MNNVAQIKKTKNKSKQKKNKKRKNNNNNNKNNTRRTFPRSKKIKLIHATAE